MKTAIDLLAAGFSVLPCGADKRALVDWKKYQSRPMTEEEARRCFVNGARLGVVCGAVSGGLECLDFDDPGTFEPFLDLVREQAPDLPDRLSKFKTPSGGFHIVYRHEGGTVQGNMKLASTVEGQVRIETRGEGGYFLTAPSPGYEHIGGPALANRPRLSAAEVEILHATARAFDLRQQQHQATAGPSSRNDGIRPGDQFNGAHTCCDVLQALGWTEGRRTTAGTGWTRPGKQSGCSGVVLDQTGNFYCWSSNAAPLEAGSSYTPFALVAALEHGGDFQKAARALCGEGYGDPARRTDGQDMQGREDWQCPLPLPKGLPPVAPFDFALLPETLRPWAEDIAERVQCPPDYLAVAIMAGLGAVIGRKVGIRPQAKTDWTVTPNQWALVVGRPGVLKSPALEAAIAPLKRLAQRAQAAFDTGQRQYGTAAALHKLKVDEATRSARKAVSEGRDNDAASLLAVEDPEAPTLRRYIAVDSNAASLGELHRQNPNGLLVHRDEMVSLLKALDREDQAEARGFYLTGWNGDSSYTLDRIMRGLNLHIPGVCLSLLGGTQPGRLSEYVRHAVRGGAGDDGLMQRFGLLVWPDNGGEWRNVDRWPDTHAKNTAFNVFERLDDMTPESIGAEQDTFQDGNPDGVPYLRFTPEALRLFLEWRYTLEIRLRGGDLHPAMESHLSKYRKLVPGLALICHLAGGGTGPVSEGATLQALAWSEYLETHAARCYASVTVPEVAAAKAILDRIRKGDLARQFSGWQVWRPGWSHLADREQVQDALRLLVDLGWLRETRRTDTGGRHGTTYEVNPRGAQHELS